MTVRVPQRELGAARFHRLATVVALVGFACASMLIGCGRDRAYSPDSFVRASGRAFTVDGRPFRFVGFNLFDAAAGDDYSCAPERTLDERQLDHALRFARERGGATVLRFWAYQTYSAGATDFSGIDRVLRLARRHHLRVLPVLEDGPGDCTADAPGVPKAEFENDTWFTTGYRQPHGASRLSYRDYVSAIASHYRNDPTILGWSMMNEAETSTRDASGRSVLIAFAEDIAGQIQHVDPNHLVTVGTQANGAPGASGPDFTDVYGLENIDFVEVHDWAHWGSDRAAMPGGTANGKVPAVSDPTCAPLDAPIGCSFARSVDLDKPLVVGEAGIRARDAGGRTVRAKQLDAKMTAAFAGGASGYLVWHLNSAPSDDYDVIIDSNDSLLDVLKRQSKAIRTF
jgi:mannan endo-1,4-beta-mannosidase